MIANEGTSGMDASELISLTNSWPSPGRIWSAVLEKYAFPEGVIKDQPHSKCYSCRRQGNKTLGIPSVAFQPISEHNVVEIFLLTTIILLLKFIY